MNRLNIFDPVEIPSLPEEPYPGVNYSIVNNKLNLLELKLLEGDAITTKVADDLKSQFLLDIVFLLKNDCSFLGHTSGVDVTKDDEDSEYFLSEPNLNVALGMHSGILPDNMNADSDIFSHVDRFTLVFDSPLMAEGGTDAFYSYNGKLDYVQQLAIWRLTYAVFFYKLMDWSISEANAVEITEITIPLDHMESQLTIMKRLIGLVTSNVSLTKYYKNLSLYVSISERSKPSNSTEDSYLFNSYLSPYKSQIESLNNSHACSRNDASRVVKLTIDNYVDNM